MPRMGVYDQIKSAFQDIVAPEIHALRGEIARLDGRITALDAKVDGLDGKMVSMKAELLAEIRRVDTRIDAVHARIDSVDKRLDSLDRNLHMVIDVRERLAALEAPDLVDPSANQPRMVWMTSAFLNTSPGRPWKIISPRSMA